MQETSTTQLAQLKEEPAKPDVPPVPPVPQSPTDTQTPPNIPQSILKNESPTNTSTTKTNEDFPQTPLKRRRLSNQQPYTQSFLRHHHQQQQSTPYYPHHRSLSSIKNVYHHQIKVVPPVLPPPLPTTTTTTTKVQENPENSSNADTILAQNIKDEKPATEPTVEEKCTNCGKTGDLSRCSVCRWAMYCNGQCQMKHWPTHKKECKKPPTPAPTEHPTYARYPQSPNTNTSPRNYYSSQMYSGRSYSSSYSSYMKSSPNMNGIPSSPRMMNNAVQPRKYRCNICLKTFKNGHALGGHRSSVHSVGSARRKVVDKENKLRKRSQPRVRNKSRRRSRATVNKDGKYECQYCGKIFLSGNALGGHISGAHTKRHGGRNGAPLRLRRKRSLVGIESESNDVKDEYGKGSPRRNPSRSGKGSAVVDGNGDGSVGESLDSWRGSGGSKCDGCDTPVQAMADDVQLIICERCKYTCCDHCLKDHSTGTCYCKTGNFGSAYPEKREWWMRGMW